MAYFNYRNLDPTDFEALALDVMQRRLGCRLYRYAQGTDGGIDLCDDIKEKHIVVQCKRYQQGSFNELYSVLKREEKPKIESLSPCPKKYYVFTSLELNPQQKEKILDLFHVYMEDESHIVDGIEINNFFRDEKNHDLIKRNIKLFLSFPENYVFSTTDLLWLEENKFFDRLTSIFTNERKGHPSIRMMDPDPNLFPKGLPEIKSDNRLAVVDKESPRAIKDMILDSWKRDDKRHILLVGEGGIGKTVAMLTLPEEDWFRQHRIPVIYVPLQRLDAYEGRLNEYLREKFGADHDRIIELANRDPEGHPRLLLLLDGFNEIPDKFKLTAEKFIREWMGMAGVQIITTSRLGFSLENDFSKYQLQTLPKKTVESFLMSAGIKKEHLPNKNDPIWKVINVPLKLTLYTQIDKVKVIADRSSVASLLDWREADNAAHIIWNFLQTELYRCIDKADTYYSPMQYVTAILLVAPYVCCQMSRKIKFNIDQEEMQGFIREALSFYGGRQNMVSRQFQNLRKKYDRYSEEDLFGIKMARVYSRILVENIALFQEQEICDEKGNLMYAYSLMHQNFRDALAAFFISLCLPKATDSSEKSLLLDSADYYVKNYIAEFLSDEELIDIWDKHREEEPEDGHITFILMDIIGRQRNYDYRELDFSGLDLTKTNLHTLLSRRLDICPFPSDSRRFARTKITLACLSPNGPEEGINSVAYSPDGRHVASSEYFGTVRIWDSESGESRILESYADWVVCLAYSPDGRCLASGTTDGSVQIWDLESGKILVLEEDHEDCVSSVAYSPDGRHLASGADDGTVRIWDLKSRESRVLGSHAGWTNNVSYSPDGKHLASSASDGLVRIWDLENGKSRNLECQAGTVGSIAYSPDGRHVASSAGDTMVCIWDLESGKSHILKGHTGWVSSIAYSPDGRYLTTGAFDKTVRIWDLESGKSHILEGHTDFVNSVAYSPDGRHLVSGASDRTVRIWNLERRECRVLEGPAGWIRSVTYRPDGRHLAGGASDKTVRIWDLKSGKSRVLDGHIGVVLSVDYSPDGSHLASGASDRTVRIWDLESGERRMLEGLTDWVFSVAYSPDGRYVASGASDRMVRIWNQVSRESRMLEGQTGWIRSVAYSPDGKHLASGADDGTVRIWDLESVESRVLKGHEDGVNSVAYSPDGSHLASGADDTTMRIWDVESGESRVLEDYTGRVSSVAYSPDGMYVASSTEGGAVYIWDVESGGSRALIGHTDRVMSVAYSPDGRYLASGAGDSTVRIWDLEKYCEVKKYSIIPHLNLSGANFELADIISEEDKETLRCAGAKV